MTNGSNEDSLSKYACDLIDEGLANNPRITINEYLKSLESKRSEMDKSIYLLKCQFADVEQFTKDADHEFHTRLKMLERDIRGYEGGFGLKYEFNEIKTRMEKLEKSLREMGEAIIEYARSKENV